MGLINCNSCSGDGRQQYYERGASQVPTLHCLYHINKSREILESMVQ